jgi:hypothetical protein
MAPGTISPLAVLRDARIEVGCCRFRHFLMPKSGKPDFGAGSLYESEKQNSPRVEISRTDFRAQWVGAADGQLRMRLKLLRTLAQEQTAAKPQGKRS